ncbi:MAG: VOC family protein [Saprospiraceae bacterium]|nr:VOC family protein [Saprospiraceae bacterium]
MTACSDLNQSNAISSENEKLKIEIDSLKASLANEKSKTENAITTFLTFQENNAEEAMNFYVNLFDNSKVLEVQRYGSEVPAPEGSIMLAKFNLNGKDILCSDSFIKHEWDFSPAVSMFVKCQNAQEQESLFEQLSKDGQVMMPLDNYGFSQRFGWVEDQFGISWQLNLD